LGQFSAQDWRNRAVTDPYEPGSTLKIVMAAAALEEHVMNPDTLIYGGEGQMAVAGTIVHDPAKTSWMTFSEAVAQSSNVGAIKVAMELGQDRVFEYLRAFGFGEKTDIDLPGESSGILREPSKWSGRSLSSIAMGQEIAVTPIQMVTAMSVVANGGWLMTPYVVSSVLDSQGQAILSKDPLPKRRPISPETAGALTRILETAVETGTGKRAKLAEYRAAGKTGTAQKFDQETGSYSSSRVIASFVGIAPVDQPRLTMLVVIDEPKIGNWGGEIAAPVFRKVAERVLPHLGVLPGGSPIIRTAAATSPIPSQQLLVQ
jgi:cell division protein FtsI (penicillin-binding protein 3)